MKIGPLVALAFVGCGIIIAIVALRDILSLGVNLSSAVLLLLSFTLMICGVLFKNREELDQIGSILGMENKEINGLKRGKGKEASGWRIRDMEERLKGLEEKA